MGEWEQAPEWRRVEAEFYTAEQRGCLRSWGCAVLEPPAGATPGLGCMKQGCVARALPHSNYCKNHGPNRNRCTENSHDADCTASPEPRGICGHRGWSATSTTAMLAAEQAWLAAVRHETQVMLDQYHERRFSLDSLYGVSVIQPISGGH